MEEQKKKAVEKLRSQMEEDYSRGYGKAVEMVEGGTIDLQVAEDLATADEPKHEVFFEQSRKFVEGFIDGLEEMLKEAREKKES
jgi:hypothetical protein